MKVIVTKVGESKAKLRIELTASDAKGVGLGPGMTIPERCGQVIVINASDKRSAARLLVSVGKQDEINAERIRQAAGHAAKWLACNGWSSAVALQVCSKGELEQTEASVAAVEGFVMGSYRFDRHKTDNASKSISRVEYLSSSVSAKLKSAIQRTLRVCDGVFLARDLAHEPPNVINPVTLASRARRIAQRAGLGCKIYDHRELSRMRMGGMIAVGQGSKSPPRLIELSYKPPKSSRQKPIVLIGKAITFDTGGYSIKPSDGMLGMKYDKCGGMTVIGAMQAVAACKLNVPVVGLVAAAENMISGDAYRPDDIIKMRNGKTVQIVSADAEGRMVLADSIAYACQKHKPRAMIDLATLTGGVVVALGKFSAGVFSNNDRLCDALIDSGRSVHERLWRLPVWDDHFELIKGDDSDMKNSGSRQAHAICGAIFLKQFVEGDTPWAHLDIAGVSDHESDQPYCPKGASGFGVRLLLDYLTKLRS